MTEERTRWVFVFGLMMGAASSAVAAPTIKLTGNPYQVGIGGEFTATVMSEGFAGNPVGSTWETFCVEMDEHVSLGRTYYAVVNTATVDGGAGGPSPDPLSPETAWLFSQFLQGTLLGYNYSDVDARRTSAAALQNTIWYLEQEVDSLDSALATDFYNSAKASGWMDIHHIRVLNLYSDAALSAVAQDVLAAVPTPGAVLLATIGTTLVGVLRRRAM